MATPRFHSEVTADTSQFQAAMEAAAKKAITSAQATESAWREAAYNKEMEARAAKALTDAQAMQSSWRETTFGMGQAVAQSVRGMNAQFDGLREGIKAIRGALAAVSAIIAGSALFVKMATDSAEAARTTEELARTLGVTTQEASALIVALDDIEVRSESYTSMVARMVARLRENEERFNRLGIATRDGNGQLLDTQAIMENALRALTDFKEGTDRNLASTEVFGRGWEEVNRLMRLTPAVMEEARRKAVELQTEVGPAGAERARAYRLAISDLGDVAGALANRVGQALMPILTDFANWLSGAGPAAVLVLRGALGGILTVFYGLRNAVIIVWELIKAMIFSVTEPLVAMGEAVGLALSGNFEAAGKRLAQGDKNIAARWSGTMDEILKSSAETAKRIGELFDFKEEQGGPAPQPKGVREFEPEDKNRLARWEADLAAQRDAFDRMKLEQGSFQSFSKAQERDYWAEILASADLTKDERIAVLKKFYEAERDLRKQAFETEIADIKARMEKFRAGSAERIQLATEAARRIGERYGLESKEYKTATAEVIRLAEERRKQQEKLADMALERQRQASASILELERQAVEQAAELGQITAEQKLALLRQLKEREFQIELQAEIDKAAIYQQDEVQYQQHLDRIAALKERHRLELGRLDGQIRVQSFKVWRDIGDAVSGAFSTAVKGVLLGTQTLREAFRNLGQTVLLALIDMGAKWLAQQAVNAIIGKFIEKESAVGKITANAAVAASGAAASVAAIPFYGWAMAPAVAASTFAETMSWVGPALSAAQGFDIPRGLNPMTQLHEEEMVLPAHLANPLREQLTEGGGMGGGDTINVSIKALDGADVYRVLSRNSAGVARMLRELARDHAPMPSR